MTLPRTGLVDAAPATPRDAPTVYARSTTPTLRRLVRRSSFWLILAGIVLVGATVLLVTGGQGAVPGDPYAIDNAAPAGSMAVAEVLRDHGVTVTAAGSLDEAEKAAAPAGRGDTTIFFYDPQGFFPDDEVDGLAGLAYHVVLFQPTGEVLRQYAPGVAPAGVPSDSTTLDAGCSLPAAQRAGEITPAGSTYRSTDASAQAQLCFRSFDDAYSLIHLDASGPLGGNVTVLGANDVLTNEGVARAGNAALALGLLGEAKSLVWYIPTAADLEVTAPPSLAELTPGWVTPVIVLAILVFAAAAVWRGRRLGAVVIEDLPVTVRSRETMEGRARLYAKAGAHPRAADALRIGTITRLSRKLALPRNASVAEVVAAASATTGLPLQYVATVLVTEIPGSEADLMRLSDRLGELERAVAAAQNPAQPHPAPQNPAQKEQP
jgi:hypothetical protein